MQRLYYWLIELNFNISFKIHRNKDKLFSKNISIKMTKFKDQLAQIGSIQKFFIYRKTKINQTSLIRFKKKKLKTIYVAHFGKKGKLWSINKINIWWVDVWSSTWIEFFKSRRDCRIIWRGCIKSHSSLEIYFHLSKSWFQ